MPAGLLGLCDAPVRDETAGSWHTGPQECGQGRGGSFTLRPHEIVV